MLDCICLAQSALLGCGFGFGTGCACWVLFAAALCTATLPKLLLLSAGVSCRACGVSIAVFINAQQVRVPQTHGCGLCRGGCYLRCYGDHGVSVSHTRQMSPHTYLVARQHWIRSDHICLLFQAVHVACTITADDACHKQGFTTVTGTCVDECSTLALTDCVNQHELGTQTCQEIAAGSPLTRCCVAALLLLFCCAVV